jgi:hypothetical protein
MMKQTEDAGEKMGVGTWVDLLSGACRIPFLPYLFYYFWFRFIPFAFPRFNFSAFNFLGGAPIRAAQRLHSGVSCPPLLLRTSAPSSAAPGTLWTPTGAYSPAPLTRRAPCPLSAVTALIWRLFGAVSSIYVGSRISGAGRGGARVSAHCFCANLRKARAVALALAFGVGGHFAFYISRFNFLGGLLCYRSCAFLQFAAGGG